MKRINVRRLVLHQYQSFDNNEQGNDAHKIQMVRLFGRSLRRQWKNRAPSDQYHLLLAAAFDSLISIMVPINKMATE